MIHPIVITSHGKIKVHTVWLMTIVKDRARYQQDLPQNPVMGQMAKVVGEDTFYIYDGAQWLQT